MNNHEVEAYLLSCPGFTGENGRPFAYVYSDRVSAGRALEFACEAFPLWKASMQLDPVPVFLSNQPKLTSG